MILTNQFTATYDLEAIDRDFDIYLVHKNKDLYAADVLDAPLRTFKARAVQYTRGANAFVLFDKGKVHEYELKKTIAEAYPTLTVEKISVSGQSEEELRNLFWFNNRLLLLLLANSLHVPTTEGFTYNNLTGELFYLDPSRIHHNRKTGKPDSFCALEISFAKGMYLTCEVKTFRQVWRPQKGTHKDAENSERKSLRKGARYYLFDQNTGMLRRKLRDDNVPMEELFTVHSYKGSHNTVPFLNLGSFENFRKCKLGVMEQFLRDVHKYLGAYVTLTSVTRENDKSYEFSKAERDGLKEEDITSLLEGNVVNLVDACKTEESAQIMQGLMCELHRFYGIEAQVGELSQDAYNIRLIREPEYYQDEGLPDPHNNEALAGMVVQHMTLEKNLDLIAVGQKKPLNSSVGDKPSPKVHKVLTELIMKGDIQNKRVSIRSWQSFGFDKSWTFVMREKIKAADGQQFEECKNAAGKSTKDRHTYKCVQINPDGRMEFSSFDDLALGTSGYEEKLREVYERYYDAQRKAGREVEGLAFSDLDNIQVIIRTNEQTMPNTAALWEALKATNDKDVILCSVLVEALDAFAQAGDAEAKFAERVLSGLQGQPSITKKELRELINMRTRAAKGFNRFLHEAYGIWVSAELKSSAFEEDYMLGNVTGIQSYVNDDTDGAGVRSLNYYASVDNLKFSLNRACIVRQVRAERELDFEQLLPLLAVDFVRIGQYTVLPFPFKYLREWLGLGR